MPLLLSVGESEGARHYSFRYDLEKTNERAGANRWRRAEVEFVPRRRPDIRRRATVNTLNSKIGFAPTDPRESCRGADRGGDFAVRQRRHCADPRGTLRRCRRDGLRGR